MKISQLKELVKQVVKEENDYQQLFKHMLDMSGKDSEEKKGKRQADLTGYSVVKEIKK